jgi:hypothetical protein
MLKIKPCKNWIAYASGNKKVDYRPPVIHLFNKLLAKEDTYIKAIFMPNLIMVGFCLKPLKQTFFSSVK